ncbi:MAG: hypothetical protein EOM44_02825 [Bacteroidia bacterium]|nr:hypothetical protein [Bacteroidia bacterium]HRG04275.1 hypothetical protein [Paludibacteraceae bacterium]
MNRVTKILLILNGLLASLAASASDVSATAMEETSLFYTQLWFWVAVGIVFFFLLVILLRGSNRS